VSSIVAQFSIYTKACFLPDGAVLSQLSVKTQKTVIVAPLVLNLVFASDTREKTPRYNGFYGRHIPQERAHENANHFRRGATV
jgi:hypothetical protein